MGTSCFINALSKFISRRGKPATLACDNGNNFIGRKNELEASLKDIYSNKVGTSLLQQGIAWKFNPPASPNMEGTYEKLIRSVRSIMNALCNDQALSDESLITLLCNVERIPSPESLTT